MHFISPQAYKNWLKKHKEKDLPKIGLSHDQLFYLSFAHVMNTSNVSFSLSISSTLLQFVILNIQSLSPLFTELVMRNDFVRSRILFKR